MDFSKNSRRETVFLNKINQELYDAAVKGDYNAALSAIQNQAEVNCTNDEGWTPLAAAAMHRHIEIVKLLIDRGANINSRSNLGWTPLAEAGSRGFGDIIKLLLDNGADVNNKNNKGWTPLHEVIAQRNSDNNRENSEIVELFIKAGADVSYAKNDGWTPLAEAARRNHIKTAQLLLGKGAEVNSKNENGWTPLAEATDQGHIEMVKLLLESGADVNCRNNDGWTPLAEAAKGNNVTIVQLLLQNKADINNQNKDGWTPLHEAAYRDYTGVMQLLLDKGADVNLRNKGNQTPLHLAAKKNLVGATELLLQYTDGSNEKEVLRESEVIKQRISVMNRDAILFDIGETLVHPEDRNFGLLHLAVWLHHEKAIRWLLKLLTHEDIASAFENGFTPLHLAAAKGNIELVKILLSEYKFKLDSQTKDGQTFLMWVITRSNNPEVIKILLDHGANVNLQDKLGWTALHHAVSVSSKFQRSASEVLSLLMKYSPDLEAKTTEGQGPFEVDGINLKAMPLNIVSRGIFPGINHDKCFAISNRLVKSHFPEGEIKEDWLHHLIEIFIQNEDSTKKFNDKKFLQHISGCYIYFESVIPERLANYTQSYILVENEKALYYVKSEDNKEKVIINDFDKLIEDINKVRVIKNSTKLALTGEQIQEVIEENGNHRRDKQPHYEEELLRALKLIYARLTHRPETAAPTENKQIFNDNESKDNLHDFKLNPKTSMETSVTKNVSQLMPLSESEKAAILSKIFEENERCFHGFSTRVFSIVQGFFHPDSMEDLLFNLRRNLVESVANEATTEVHTHNRFYTVASAGLGVLPLDSTDPGHGDINDNEIINRLIRKFQETFRLYPLIEELVMEIKNLLITYEYFGKKEPGYSLERLPNENPKESFKENCDLLLTSACDPYLIVTEDKVSALSKFANQIANLYLIDKDNRFFYILKIGGKIIEEESEEITKGEVLSTVNYLRGKYPNLSNNSPEKLKKDDIKYITSNTGHGLTRQSKKILLILPFYKSKIAYVRSGEQLFYVNRVQNKCDLLDVTDDFLESFNSKMNVKLNIPKKLSNEELEWITSVIHHTPAKILNDKNIEPYNLYLYLESERIKCKAVKRGQIEILDLDDEIKNPIIKREIKEFIENNHQEISKSIEYDFVPILIEGEQEIPLDTLQDISKNNNYYPILIKQGDAIKLYDSETKKVISLDKSKFTNTSHIQFKDIKFLENCTATLKHSEMEEKALKEITAKDGHIQCNPIDTIFKLTSKYGYPKDESYKNNQYEKFIEVVKVLFHDESLFLLPPGNNLKLPDTSKECIALRNDGRQVIICSIKHGRRIDKEINLNLEKEKLTALQFPENGQNYKIMKRIDNDKELFDEIISLYLREVLFHTLKVDSKKGDKIFILDINWKFVRQQLMRKLILDKYLIYSYEDIAERDGIIFKAHDSIDAIDFFNHNELSQEQFIYFLETYSANKSPEADFLNNLFNIFASRGDIEKCAYLFSKGINPDLAINPLIQVSSANVDKYENFLKKLKIKEFSHNYHGPHEEFHEYGKDVERAYEIPKIDKTWYQQQTPLMSVISARNNSYALAQLLLTHGANANFANNQGWTALHQLALMSRMSLESAESMLPLLIEFGVDIDAKIKGHRSSAIATDKVFRRALLNLEFNTPGSDKPKSISNAIRLQIGSSGYESVNKGMPTYIKINGHDISKPCSRGLNVAIVDEQTGKEKNFRVFDTNGWVENSEPRPAKPEDFTQFVKDNFSKSDLIIITAHDDAKARLHSEIKNKLKKLGSEYIDKLEYRGSWIFVARKNGHRIAEKLGKPNTYISKYTKYYATCYQEILDDNLLRAELPKTQIILELQEHEVDPNGDCGFTTLGVDRKIFAKTLYSLKDNPKAREDLVDDIREAFITYEITNGQEGLSPPQNWSPIIQAYYKTEEEDLVKLKNKIFYRLSDEITKQPVDQLIKWLKEHDKFEDAFALSERNEKVLQKENFLKSYYMEPDVFQYYVEGLGNTGLEMSCKSALLYAKQTNTMLYIWKKIKNTNLLELMDFYDSGSATKNIIHMLYTNGYKHFNILSEPEQKTINSNLFIQDNLESVAFLESEINSLIYEGEHILYEQHKPNEAIVVFRKVLGKIEKLLTKESNNYRAITRKVKVLTDMGEAYSVRGQIEEALSCFDKALAISPNAVSAQSRKDKILSANKIPGHETNKKKTHAVTSTAEKNSFFNSKLELNKVRSILQQVGDNDSLKATVYKQLFALINRSNWQDQSINIILKPFLEKFEYKNNEVLRMFSSALSILAENKIQDNIENYAPIKILSEKDPHRWELELHNLAKKICFNVSSEDKSLKTLLEEIGELNQYSNDQIKRLEDRFNVIQKCETGYSAFFQNGKVINQWDKQDIKTWAYIVQARKETVRLSEHLPELIAVVKRTAYLHHDFPPRTIQVLSLLLLIAGESTRRLAQITTGEGKSNIIAMLAAIKALQGEQVDIVTSSYLLAKRDTNDFTPFYTLLNLEVGENSGLPENENEKKKSCYKKHIVYGDTLHFEGDILRDEYQLENTRLGRGFCTVIIDEADNALIDACTHFTRLSQTKPGLDQLNLVLTAIWQRLCILEERIIKKDENTYLILEGNDSKQQNNDNVGNIDNYKLIKIDNTANFIKEELIYFIKNQMGIGEKPLNPPSIQLPAHLQDFAVKQLGTWIEHAYFAKHVYCENHHYLIKEDENNIKRIVPIDYKNTGVIQNRMVWSDGLHQFLELKHHLALTAQGFNTNFLSNMSYFRRYRQLYGLTGTLGSTEAQHMLADIYHLDFVFVPTYKPKKFVVFPGIVVDDSKEKWRQTIVERALEETKCNRAVLIICETINDCDSLEKELISRGQRSDKLKRYTRDDKKQEQEVVTQEAKEGDIIVATNLAGRGTDLKITSNVADKHDGLHVCLTYLPNSLRVEQQAFGRAARQGQAGTAQLVIYSSDYQRHTLASLKLARDAKEIRNLNAIRNRVSIVELQDDLFIQFCDILHELRKEYKDTHILDAVEERWGIWLKLHEQEIENSQSFEVQEKIQTEFRQFRHQLQEDKRNNQLIKNAYYLVLEGNRLARDKRYDEADGKFRKAVELDPVFSAQAYFNWAYNYGKKLDKQKFKEYLTIAENKIKEYLIPQPVAILALINNPQLFQASADSELNQHLRKKLEILTMQLKNIEDARAKIDEYGDINDVEISLKPLSSFYSDNNKPTLMIRDFWWEGLSGFLEIKKKPSWLGGLIVGLLGVVQIAGGIILTALSAGAATQIGATLISEGIQDIVYAVQSTINGNFNWSEWGQQKALRIATSLGTAGISAFASKILDSKIVNIINVGIKNGKLVKSVAEGNYIEAFTGAIDQLAKLDINGKPILDANQATQLKEAVKLVKNVAEGNVMGALTGAVDHLATLTDVNGKPYLSKDQADKLKSALKARENLANGDVIGAFNDISSTININPVTEFKQYVGKIKEDFNQSADKIIPKELKQNFESFVVNEQYKNLGEIFQQKNGEFLQQAISQQFQTGLIEEKINGLFTMANTDLSIGIMHEAEGRAFATVNNEINKIASDQARDFVKNAASWKESNLSLKLNTVVDKFSKTFEQELTKLQDELTTKGKIVKDKEVKRIIDTKNFCQQLSKKITSQIESKMYAELMNSVSTNYPAKQVSKQLHEYFEVKLKKQFSYREIASAKFTSVTNLSSSPDDQDLTQMNQKPGI